MTIKDVEFRTGMTRANIRFYESEGLLSPKRNENGYRDYSEEDIEVLMRIKLLRTLHISLEEIKAVHNKEIELETLLEKHVQYLEKEKKQIEQSQNVCELMRNDHVKYESLNAGLYLNKMNESSKEVIYKYDTKVDVIPKVYAPWRRYFARYLDFTLYTVLLDIILACGLRLNILNMGNVRTIVTTIFALILTAAIEPLLISKFRTTLGKAVLGIYVTDLDDGNLSYDKSLHRTLKVLWRGMGCQIPIYNYVRLWKSYSALNESTDLEWEYDSNLVLRDTKFWRWFVYVVINVFAFGMMVLSIEYAEMPKNRGDITIAEFCENYNQLSRYYGIDEIDQLDVDGTWKEYNNSTTVVFSLTPKISDFQFEEKDGYIKSVSLSYQKENNQEYMIGSYQNEMIVSILAFVQAQDEYKLFSDELEKIAAEISESPFKDFEYELCGIRVMCDFEYEGYVSSESTGFLISEEGMENYLSLSFKMEKIDS